MQQPPQATIVCGACQALLSYPAGAPMVACGRCQSVNQVVPSTAPGSSLPVACPTCATVSSFPYGTTTGQCPTCKQIFMIPQPQQQQQQHQPTQEELLEQEWDTATKETESARLLSSGKK
eukprot:PhM_4_TR17610/c0_g1_i1/m.40128